MPTNILILGAGYAGLVCALQTRKDIGPETAKITLVNKHSYHQLITQLHESAVGARSDRSVRIPLSRVLRGKDIDLIKGTVKAIDPDGRQVTLNDGTAISYDRLVVALGSETEYFGITGLKEHSFTLKSLNQARLIRSHIDSCFARYLYERRPELLRFVVGGAGFSGIELVGELADALPKLAAEAGIDYGQVEIYNIEAMPGILPGFDSELVKVAYESLQARGVRFMTGVPIVAVEDGKVHLKTGEVISAQTIIWTGGVRGNQIVVDSGLESDARGRAKVDAYLRSVSYPDVFVIGDAALVPGEDGRPLPPTAQLAWQMGAFCARALAAELSNRPVEPFKPAMMGSIASLGRKEAVGKVGRSYRTRGRVAYLLKDASQIRYLAKIGAVFAGK